MILLFEPHDVVVNVGAALDESCCWYVCMCVKKVRQEHDPSSSWQLTRTAFLILEFCSAAQSLNT